MRCVCMQNDVIVLKQVMSSSIRLIKFMSSSIYLFVPRARPADHGQFDSLAFCILEFGNSHRWISPAYHAAVGRVEGPGIPIPICGSLFEFMEEK